MINKDQATFIVRSISDGRIVRFVKELSGHYIFVCTAADRSVVPDKIIVAVSKATGKTGMSIFNDEEAIAAAK